MTKDQNVRDNLALLDMDGVVADWHGALQRDLKDVLGKDLKRLSPRARQRVEWLIRGQDGWYLNLKPIPLGLYIEKTLRDIGFTVMIATKATTKTPTAWSEKVKWCTRHLPNVELMTVTGDKTKIYGKILVDDMQKFAEPWLRHRPRGIVIMPDQPWNKGYRHPRVYRVKTKTDVKKLRPILTEAYNR